MKYLVAAGVACLIVGASLAYHWWVKSGVAALLEQARVRQGPAPGALPNDLGIPMTGRQILCIEIDHLLMRFWFILLPLVWLICLGIAAWLPGARSAAIAPADSSDKG